MKHSTRVIPENAGAIELRYRKIQKLYAKANGYFWIPCPLCGREFGGHEWHDIGDLTSTIYVRADDPMTGTAICPVCTAQGKGQKYIPIFLSTESHEVGQE